MPALRVILLVIVGALLLSPSACGGGGDESNGGDGDEVLNNGGDGTENGSSDADGSSGGTDQPTEDAGFDLELVVSRGGNLECYSFHSDGSVELRHGGLPDVNDIGTVSGDDTAGAISWESGRQSSYEWDGEYYYVDGAQGAIIETCLP